MTIADTTDKPQVVVLGGGNGTSRLLRALLPSFHNGDIASLHALVHMADDGGSTGRLRQQYAVGAMGDLTKCLLALSKFRGDVRGEEFLRALEYRFADGDFEGHTLRNALLAALELTSDLDAAVATFARVLQIPKYTGAVSTTLVPLTQRVVSGKAGEVLGEGQYDISWNVDLQRDGSRPSDVRVTFVEDGVSLNPRAKEVLSAATHIIVAPGHTYGSIFPTLASLSMNEGYSFADSEVKIFVVMTLLTTPLHTVGWSGEDFIVAYESYLGRKVDAIVANTGRVDIDLVSGQDWVVFSGDCDGRLMKRDIVSSAMMAQQKGDAVLRALVVHDVEKMRDVLRELIV